ncbi:hypothetical protein [Mycobacterium seoulense]|uniref:Uncharacterized protein n=1 Tax=Mycobacterium seoulense TaxID=386911 RepID=A0A7I7P5K4_9MYCO|nr:hypothetical protein [Mycobacterium seoulense]BBY04146.1 hypothetical protein MSEO_46450 [Mycobacterium seoulense]
MNMQFGGTAASEGFAELASYYDLWRRLANSEGRGPYEEPDWHEGSLYLRSDYWDKIREWPQWAEFGDWSAWVIAPMRGGCFRVLRSLKHERAAQRSEEISAIFSRFVDAGKYVILRMGDSLRSGLRLNTLFIQWDDRGLNQQLEVGLAGPDVIDLLCTEMPTLDKESVGRYLKRYTLKGDPDSFAYTFPSEEPRMEILALSFEELTAALLDGMPKSITSMAGFGES